MHASEVVHLHDYLPTCTLPSDMQPTQLSVSLDIHTYLRTETHFQVVSRQAQAQVQGNKQKKGNPLLTTFVRE